MIRGIKANSRKNYALTTYAFIFLDVIRLVKERYKNWKNIEQVF